MFQYFTYENDIILLQIAHYLIQPVKWPAPAHHSLTVCTIQQIPHVSTPSKSVVCCFSFV